MGGHGLVVGQGKAAAAAAMIFKGGGPRGPEHPATRLGPMGERHVDGPTARVDHGSG